MKTVQLKRLDTHEQVTGFEIEQPALWLVIAIICLAIAFVAGVVYGLRSAHSEDAPAARLGFASVQSAPAQTLSITVRDALGHSHASTCTRSDPFSWDAGNVVVNCTSDQLFCSAFGSAQ